MASKAVRGLNASYAQRHARKPQKGVGVYADQLPGLPRGVHAQTVDRETGRNLCRCGRCGG